MGELFEKKSPLQELSKQKYPNRVVSNKMGRPGRRPLPVFLFHSFVTNDPKVATAAHCSVKKHPFLNFFVNKKLSLLPFCAFSCKIKEMFKAGR